MALSDPSSQLKIEIIPALADKEPVLANLLELYIHDFGEFINVRLGSDGRYGYDRLSSYWRDPGRYPFLITVGGELGGFALVQRGSQISGNQDVWDLTEFFVVRRYRRHGVGTRAAHQVWQGLHGRWEVRVIDLNRKAVKFWAHAVGKFVGHPVIATQYDIDGVPRHLFSFESEPPS